MALDKYLFNPGDTLPTKNVDSIDPENTIFGTEKAGILGGKVYENLSFDVLIVGGGGAAGRSGSTPSSSGGGGGGLIELEEQELNVGSYNIVIGDGGVGTQWYGDGYPGNPGGDTTFNGFKALGGGGGCSSSSRGLGGGCGGGGRSFSERGQALQALEVGIGIGFDGGYSSNGSGGGGAGGVGGENDGGPGEIVWGTTYAKGGNGANSSYAQHPAEATAPNTGDGGNSSSQAGASGGSGASGIVKVRYITANKPPTMTITGGTITTNGAYTYHTFTSDGTLTIADSREATRLSSFQTLGSGDNDGKFNITIDGIDYTNVSVDLSSVSDLDDVASAVQTAIRARTGNTEFVSYSNYQFKIESSIGGNFKEISILTSPTTGTDISGNSYLDLGSNATIINGKGEAFRLVRLKSSSFIPVEHFYGPMLFSESELDDYFTTEHFEKIFLNSKIAMELVFSNTDLLNYFCDSSDLFLDALFKSEYAFKKFIQFATASFKTSLFNSASFEMKLRNSTNALNWMDDIASEVSVEDLGYNNTLLKSGNIFATSIDTGYTGTYGNRKVSGFKHYQDGIVGDAYEVANEDVVSVGNANPWLSVSNRFFTDCSCMARSGSSSDYTRVLRYVSF